MSIFTPRRLALTIGLMMASASLQPFLLAQEPRQSTLRELLELDDTSMPAPADSKDKTDKSEADDAKDAKDDSIDDKDVADKDADGDKQEPALLDNPKPPVRLGGASIFGEVERLPNVDSGRLNLPTLMAATTEVKKIGNGSTPKKFRNERDTPLSELPESGSQRNEAWLASSYQFAAANTFSHPRYFEDIMLERHGYERYPALQPFCSGARFFATFPMLPYLMTVSPPCECQSELGYFRAGNCVYPYLQRPPYQRDAVVNEAAAVAGGIIALP